jgi:MerR family transcriptional regulator, heat shock protein HspR
VVKKQEGGGRDRPVYMISVAAELAGMHPQTLRIYERKQLVQPQRSSGNTRLYSDTDIERLRLIQQLTQEEGVNLAGVMRILELQIELDRVQAELESAKSELGRTERRIAQELHDLHKSLRGEIVRVTPGRIARRQG